MVRTGRRSAVRFTMPLLLVTALVAAATFFTPPAKAALSATVGAQDLLEVTAVDSADDDGVRISTRLIAGRRYIISVTGVYSYDGGNHFADAECGQKIGSTGFEPSPYGGDRLDLLLNTTDLAWTPVTGGADGTCDEGHTYEFLVERLSGDGQPRFRVSDGITHGDNRGWLTVAIYSVGCGSPADPTDCVPPPPPPPTPPCDVTDPAGCVPTPPCDPSVPEDCFEIEPDPCLLEGDPTDCVPPPPPPPSCDPLNPTACVPPLPPPPPPPPVPDTTPDNVSSQLVEVLQVDASDPDGRRTRQPLQGGRTYLFVVSGTFLDGTSAVADAECTSTTTDPIWSRHRYGTAPDRLDLGFGSVQVEWRAATGPADGCDPNHTYSLPLAWGGTSFATLGVNDTDHSDNEGILNVAIYLQSATQGTSVPNAGVAAPSKLPYLVDVLTVDSRNALGAFTTQPMAFGQKFVFVVTGTYAYGIGQSRADAECADAGPGTEMQRERYAGQLDVTINGADVNWIAESGDHCDPTGTYSVGGFWSGTANAHVLFRVKDTGYTDNAGVFKVFVYLV